MRDDAPNLVSNMAEGHTRRLKGGWQHHMVCEVDIGVVFVLEGHGPVQHDGDELWSTCQASMHSQGISPGINDVLKCEVLLIRKPVEIQNSLSEVCTPSMDENRLAQLAFPAKEHQF